MHRRDAVDAIMGKGLVGAFLDRRNAVKSDK